MYVCSQLFFLIYINVYFSLLFSCYFWSLQSISVSSTWYWNLLLCRKEYILLPELHLPPEQQRCSTGVTDCLELSHKRLLCADCYPDEVLSVYWRNLYCSKCADTLLFTDYNTWKSVLGFRILNPSKYQKATQPKPWDTNPRGGHHGSSAELKLPFSPTLWPSPRLQIWWLMYVHGVFEDSKQLFEPRLAERCLASASPATRTVHFDWLGSRHSRRAPPRPLKSSTGPRREINCSVLLFISPSLLLNFSGHFHMQNPFYGQYQTHSV